VEREGAVFSAAPAEEDGFRNGHQFHPVKA
jgi:hypothetical protein